ncbi:MAG: response regulator [Candidatus Wildermuthbacteria bacterium]|nr:response regulator [Candidatus Wildermuthbacteria bacterium]
MKNILLVEDDPLLVDIYKTKLEESGFGVRVVQDGNAVQGALESSKPDLILLDIVLPNVDGWSILQAIKQNEKLRAIKVAILSNLGQKEEIEKGVKLGADLYLIKAHYTPTQVVEEIKKLIP